jgi:hypothetical protein
MDPLTLIVLFALLQVAAVGFMAALTGINRDEHDEDRARERPEPSGAAALRTVAVPRRTRTPVRRGGPA